MMGGKEKGEGLSLDGKGKQNSRLNHQRGSSESVSHLLHTVRLIGLVSGDGAVPDGWDLRLAA
jgi:hypothetical protein